MAREARTTAERSRPSTQAAGTRAQAGGTRPAGQVLERPAWDPRALDSAETLARSPAGGPRGLCALLPPDCLLPKTKGEQKAGNPPAPTQNVLGPMGLSTAGATHLPLHRRLTFYILNVNRVKALQAVVRWKHHLTGSRHPQKAPLSCLGPTRGPETPRQRLCLRREPDPGPVAEATAMACAPGEWSPGAPSRT